MKGLNSSIRTTQNSLDDLELKAKTFREAVSIAGWFLSNSYTTEDLKRLKDGLDLIGVTKDPGLSTDRLLRALEGAGTLAKLLRSIARAVEIQLLAAIS